MTDAEVLHRIRTAGGDVVVVDGTLRLRAPSPLPDDLVALAREHRTALHRYLTEPRIDARTGDLVIPIDAPPEACWWRGGKSIEDTLADLEAPAEVRARYEHLH